MTADEKLIAHCIDTHDRRTNGLPPSAKRELWDEMKRLIAEYRLACDLSRVGDPDRDRAWTKNALRWQAMLRQLAYGGEVLV